MSARGNAHAGWVRRTALANSRPMRLFSSDAAGRTISLPSPVHHQQTLHSKKCTGHPVQTSVQTSCTCSEQPKPRVQQGAFLRAQILKGLPF